MAMIMMKPVNELKFLSTPLHLKYFTKYCYNQSSLCVHSGSFLCMSHLLCHTDTAKDTKCLLCMGHFTCLDVCLLSVVCMAKTSQPYRDPTDIIIWRRLVKISLNSVLHSHWSPLLGALQRKILPLGDILLAPRWFFMA